MCIAKWIRDYFERLATERMNQEEQLVRELREYDELVERIDVFRGFRRVSVWLDNDKFVRGRYLALPGKTMTKSMISAAEDDFRVSLKYLGFFNHSYYIGKPGLKMVFAKMTRKTTNKGKVTGVYFVGGYSEFDSRSVITFESERATRYSVADWSERLSEE